MGFIENLARDREQVLDALTGDQFLSHVSDPVQQGLIDRYDCSICEHGDISTRCILVKTSTFIDQLRVHTSAYLRSDSHWAKPLFVKETVSSGALKLGQWPVAFIRASELSFKCLWTY